MCMFTHYFHCSSYGYEDYCSLIMIMLVYDSEIKCERKKKTTFYLSNLHEFCHRVVRVNDDDNPPLTDSVNAVLLKNELRV